MEERAGKRGWKRDILVDTSVMDEEWSEGVGGRGRDRKVE